MRIFSFLILNFLKISILLIKVNHYRNIFLIYSFCYFINLWLFTIFYGDCLIVHDRFRWFIILILFRFFQLYANIFENVLSFKNFDVSLLLSIVLIFKRIKNINILYLNLKICYLFMLLWSSLASLLRFF